MQCVRLRRGNHLCSVETSSQKYDNCFFFLLCTASSISLSVHLIHSFLPSLLSLHIKPWLLCKCIHYSNIIHCSELQDSPCVSSLHHLVAVGPFPLYMFLVWMRIFTILVVKFTQIPHRLPLVVSFYLNDSSQ